MRETRSAHVHFQIFLLSVILLTASLSFGSSLPQENPFLYGLGLKEFVQRGPVEVYNPDTLFDYMDGEAEVYLSLKFRLLYVSRYRKPGTDMVIHVEVYDMGSPGGAQGIYGRYTQKGGNEMKGFGNAAWTDNAILLFWRDRYFFRIGPDPTLETNAVPTMKELILMSRSLDRMTAQIKQP